MTKTWFAWLALVLLVGCAQKAEEKQEVLRIEPVINYEGVSVVISEDAKRALGKELKAAMERGGVKEAVAYCNLHALAITDSVAKRYNVSVKRVTDKPRNPANQANEEELAQMAKWTKIIADKTGQVVTSQEFDTERHFYLPIRIDAFCTTCHGVPGETLTKETQAMIATNYPADQATGYQPGDLRGLWHITFKK